MQTNLADGRWQTKLRRFLRRREVWGWKCRGWTGREEASTPADDDAGGGGGGDDHDHDDDKEEDEEGGVDDTKVQKTV